MMLWLISAAFVGQVKAPPLPPKIDDNVLAAVVAIQNHSRDGQANGAIVAQSRTGIDVLTVAHLVEKGDKLSVTIYAPGPGGLLQPHLVRWPDVSVGKFLDKNKQDLALLRVDMKGAPKLAVLQLAAPEVVPAAKRFEAYSLACLTAQGAIARPELVLEASKVPQKSKAEFWKVEAKPELGRSGGPLVDAEGRLLGICSGADRNAGYYTHLSEIRSFLEKNGIIYRKETDKK